MPPVVPPFLIGLVAAPLAKRLLKPLVRGVVKTSVGLVMEVKKAAHEAGEGIHDLAAEVAADVVAAQIVAGDAEAHHGTGRQAAESSVPVQEKAGTADRAEGEPRAPRIRSSAGSGKSH
ncbi:DUF5132 domain-containing protein [Streptomyces sp. NPDC002666]